MRPGGKRSKYSFGTYHGVCGFTIRQARKNGLDRDFARNSAAHPAVRQSAIVSRLSGKGPQSCRLPKPLSGTFSLGGLASSVRPLRPVSIVSSHLSLLVTEP